MIDRSMLANWARSALKVSLFCGLIFCSAASAQPRNRLIEYNRAVECQAVFFMGYYVMGQEGNERGREEFREATIRSGARARILGRELGKTPGQLTSELHAAQNRYGERFQSLSRAQRGRDLDRCNSVSW